MERILNLFVISLTCLTFPVIINGNGSQSHQSESDFCNLPPEWHGTWIPDNGNLEQSIIIDAGNIRGQDHDHESSIGLGTCFKEFGNSKYLFQTTLEGQKCTKCAFIEHLHENVLRYKAHDNCLEGHDGESHPTVTEDVCFFPLEPQKYLIRSLDKINPIQCPFRNEAFHFNYETLSSKNPCRSRLSYVESCVDPTQIKLHYEACGDQNSETKSQELTCLGSWSQDGHTYLMSKVYETPSNQVSIRCLIISNNSHNSLLGYNLSMSGEGGSCPDSGTGSVHTSIQLNLYKDGIIRDPVSCLYPPWVRTLGLSWRSLDHGFWIETSSSKVKSELIYKDYHNEVKGKYRCREIREANDSSLSFSAFVSQVIGCDMTLSCIKITSLGPYIIQFSNFFKPDLFTTLEFEQACLSDELEPSSSKSSTRIMLTGNPEEISCPFSPGTYQFDIIIKNKNKIIYSNCTSDNLWERKPDLMMTGCNKQYDKGLWFVNDNCNTIVGKCYRSWTIGNHTYFLLSLTSHYDNNYNQTELYCLTYNDTTLDTIFVQGRKEQCIIPPPTGAVSEGIGFFIKPQSNSCAWKYNKDNKDTAHTLIMGSGSLGSNNVDRRMIVFLVISVLIHLSFN